MKNIDLNEVKYEKIKELLEAELESNGSLEIEMSYSCSKGFREFVISKWKNENGIGYQYWFDFDPNTDYATIEEIEQAKVFDGISLKEVSGLTGVQFDIITINGIELKNKI